MVKSEICKTPLSPEIIKEITPEVLEELYIVARNHDLVHLVAVSLKRNKLLKNDKISKKYMKYLHSVLMRYETIQYEQKQIYKVFEKEKIIFVPLKGSVIRNYYKDPWMRTSCDIDILVPQHELERAKEALVSSLGYAVGRYRYHDVSLYSPSGILLELHFKILENEKNIDKNLEKVWGYVHPLKEGSYQYVMTPEYLIFHSFAHMVYHFINGGIGVRYVVDAWLLDNRLEHDEEVLNKLCKECGIDYFAKCIKKLSKVWFENEQHNRLTKQLQAYIITGGVLGNSETKVMARKTKTKGQVRYLVQRIFIPYKDFCASFPKLEKYPFLYPYYTVKRWFKIFNKQIAKNAVQEIKINRNMLQEDVDDLQRMFKELGL